MNAPTAASSKQVALRDSPRRPRRRGRRGGDPGVTMTRFRTASLRFQILGPVRPKLGERRCQGVAVPVVDVAVVGEDDGAVLHGVHPEPSGDGRVVGLEARPGGVVGPAGRRILLEAQRRTGGLVQRPLVGMLTDLGGAGPGWSRQTVGHAVGGAVLLRRNAGGERRERDPQGELTRTSTVHASLYRRTRHGPRSTRRP